MSCTTISTIAYPSPPPTTNTLDSQQRTRLMRSARKLEALMGTTPYFLESDIPVTLPVNTHKDPSIPKALKRQGSIFNHYHAHSLSVTSFSSASTASLHSPSASLASLPLSVHSAESFSVRPPGLPARGRRSADKPRPLYLRMNATAFPGESIDQRCASLPPTPSSYCPSSPGFPSSPRAPSFDEVRRKRMAKLARRLGEDVPPELVLAQAPAPQIHSGEDATNGRQCNTSVDCATSQDIPSAPQTHVSSASNSDWVGEWNRPHISDVQRELRTLRVAWR